LRVLSLRSQGGRPRGRPAGYQAKKAAHLAALKAKKTALSTKALDQEPCGGSNPCQAGARCIRYGQEAKCLCPIGFTGPHCQKAYCPPLMCFHGGTCTVRSGQWLCLCRQEYAGNRCQHHRPLKAVTKRQPVITTVLFPSIAVWFDSF
jgi:EGF-like domain